MVILPLMLNFLVHLHKLLPLPIVATAPNNRHHVVRVVLHKVVVVAVMVHLVPLIHHDKSVTAILKQSHTVTNTKIHIIKTPRPVLISPTILLELLLIILPLMPHPSPPLRQ